MDAIKGVMLIVVVTAMLFVAIVKILGSGASAAGRTGAPQVYHQIRTTTDCSKLQKIFDTAWSNNRREQPLTPLYEATKSYMYAADTQMRGLGCYD